MPARGSLPPGFVEDDALAAMLRGRWERQMGRDERVERKRRRRKWRKKGSKLRALAYWMYVVILLAWKFWFWQPRTDAFF